MVKQIPTPNSRFQHRTACTIRRLQTLEGQISEMAGMYDGLSGGIESDLNALYDHARSIREDIAQMKLDQELVADLERAWEPDTPLETCIETGSCF